MLPENMPYYLHTYEGADDMPAHIKAVEAEMAHFQELFALLKPPERVGVCFDTCHAIGAGWDITTPEGYEIVIHILAMAMAG